MTAAVAVFPPSVCLQ